MRRASPAGKVWYRDALRWVPNVPGTRRGAGVFGYASYTSQRT